MIQWALDQIRGVGQEQQERQAEPPDLQAPPIPPWAGPLERSEALLLAHLDPLQVKQYQATGGFLQRTCLGVTLFGGRQYPRGRTSSPLLWTWDPWMGRLTALGLYPAAWVSLPPADILLAQSLVLRFRPQLASLACRTPVYGDGWHGMRPEALRLLRSAS